MSHRIFVSGSAYGVLLKAAVTESEEDRFDEFCARHFWTLMEVERPIEESASMFGSHCFQTCQMWERVLIMVNHARLLSYVAHLLQVFLAFALDIGIVSEIGRGYCRGRCCQ